MHNLAEPKKRHNPPPAHPAVIRVDTFQPFESRVGVDHVMRLDFAYDPVLIAHLKRFLAAYKGDAVNPALGRLAPGGWLPKQKCWFFERCIWEAVRLELEFAGYRVEEVIP